LQNEGSEMVRVAKCPYFLNKSKITIITTNGVQSCVNVLVLNEALYAFHTSVYYF